MVSLFIKEFIGLYCTTYDCFELESELLRLAECGVFNEKHCKAVVVNHLVDVYVKRGVRKVDSFYMVMDKLPISYAGVKDCVYRMKNFL